MKRKVYFRVMGNSCCSFSQTPVDKSRNPAIYDPRWKSKHDQWSKNWFQSIFGGVKNIFFLPKKYRRISNDKKKKERMTFPLRNWLLPLTRQSDWIRLFCTAVIGQTVPLQISRSDHTNTWQEFHFIYSLIFHPLRLVNLTSWELKELSAKVDDELDSLASSVFCVCFCLLIRK